MADDDLKAMLGMVITVFEQTIPMLATKDDLRQVETRLDAKIDSKIDGLRQEFEAKFDSKIDGLLQELGAKMDVNSQKIDAQTEAMRAQATGERIMKDRREISELRGAVDTLDKRFDALVRPAAE